jgi:hypothetical protein
MGGRKKKLKHSIATTEAMTDSMSPHAVAMARMPSKYANPAVVELTVIQLRQTTVVMATKAKLLARRNINTIGRTRMDLTTIVAFWQAR